MSQVWDGPRTAIVTGGASGIGLVRDDAGYITGQVKGVNGGRTT